MSGGLFARFTDRRIVRVQEAAPGESGAACLASVAEFYKRRVRYAGFASAPPASRWGANALGLVDAATALGFSAKAVRLEQHNLRNIGLPAIAELRDTASAGDDAPVRYAVLYRVGEQGVTLMDPRD